MVPREAKENNHSDKLKWNKMMHHENLSIFWASNILLVQLSYSLALLASSSEKFLWRLSYTRNLDPQTMNSSVCCLYMYKDNLLKGYFLFWPQPSLDWFFHILWILRQVRRQKTLDVNAYKCSQNLILFQINHEK